MPYLYVLFCPISFVFIPGLSRHLGSPVQLISFLLHYPLFDALSSLNPASVIIYLLHASVHLRFGRPLLLFPGMSTSSILLTMCPSFILLTWPYHFSGFSVTFLDACTTLAVPIMCSFRILSLLVTPHIHLSILISFTSSRASCPISQW